MKIRVIVTKIIEIEIPDETTNFKKSVPERGELILSSLFKRKELEKYISEEEIYTAENVKVEYENEENLNDDLSEEIEEYPIEKNKDHPEETTEEYQLYENASTCTETEEPVDGYLIEEQVIDLREQESNNQIRLLSENPINPEWLSCEYCKDYKSTNIYSLKRHISRKHTLGSYSCKSCKAAFQTGIELAGHKKRKECATCKTCLKVFPKRCQLIRHHTRKPNHK